jgi:hypothetical protein
MRNLHTHTRPSACISGASASLRPGSGICGLGADPIMHAEARAALERTYEVKGMCVTLRVGVDRGVPRPTQLGQILLKVDNDK